jgi:hypothetical protein
LSQDETDIPEIGCIAHARRKFFDLHATNQSQIAEYALHGTAQWAWSICLSEGRSHAVADVVGV